MVRAELAAVGRSWTSQTPAFRHRALALFALVGFYAAVKLIPLPGVSCQISAVKQCAPEDAAIAFVPADAYDYLHVDLDPGSDQSKQAAELAGRLPDFSAIAQGLFGGVSGRAGIDLGRDVRPWIGDEAAIAQVPVHAGVAKPLLIAAVSDEGGAEDFLVEADGQPTGKGRFDGAEVTTYAGGLASAESDGFLLFGPRAAVTSGLGAEADPSASLESDDAANEALGNLPDQRFADAYVSPDGLARLQAGGGPGASLDTFADFGSSRGFAAAAVATPDGLELHLSSVLDPKSVSANPSFFSAFPPFAPSLADLLPPDSLAALQIGDPAQAVGELLDQAEAVQPGISAAFNRLDAGLKRSAGFDITDDVLPRLGDEMGVSISAGKAGGPYVTAAFDGVDEAAARAAVARLAGPLISALSPGRTGLAPTFSQENVSGTPVVSLQLSPATTISLAAFDGHLVVSTDPHAVPRAIESADGLASNPGYRAAAGGAPGEVSALLFLDLRGLVSFGEPLGLSQIRNFSRFQQDFAMLGALGVSVSTNDDRLDTDISLQIDQGEKAK